MCTYNGERFLSEQLASIAAQTCPPDEMIVCDDGSTDATAEIIEEFARTTPFPVRFIRNPENLGSTKNFEKAIGLCTGDLIALSDQDDIWLPEKLACQAEVLQRNSAIGGVFTDGDLVDDQARPIGKKLWSSHSFTPREQRSFQAGETTSVLLKRNVVTGATLMLRSETRPLLSPIPKGWVHDGWIAWMLTIHSKLGMISEPMIQYRIHASQQVGVESLAMSRSLPLRQRLEIDKREEPRKNRLAAQLLEQLERHLIAVNNPESRAVLPALRNRINFYKHRGYEYTNAMTQLGYIFYNARNYQRYGRGIKGFVRDILLIFISPNHLKKGPAA
jgi:glycosyltransferase involved in cell wall biosynthesis